MTFDGGIFVGLGIIVLGFVMFFTSLAGSFAERARGEQPSSRGARRRLIGFAIVLVGASLLVATRPMDSAIVVALPLLALAGLTIGLAYAIQPKPGA